MQYPKPVMATDSISHPAQGRIARPIASGLSGALGISVSLWFVRAAGICPVAVEAGIGTHLGLQGAAAVAMGLILHLAFGSFLGLLIAAALRRCEWSGPIPGAVVGFTYWFVASMTIGAIPALDVLTPSGQAAVGPLGTFAGPATFYYLIAAHLFFGAWVGANT